MQVQHDGSVLVTDGRKALFLRNEGDGEFPNFILVHSWEQQLAADRDLKSGAPGRTFSSMGHGNRRSSYEETNLHEQAEFEFASNVADFLNTRMQADASGELVIVAPPRTLGVLRKRLRRDVSERVSAEIAKDLVKHPISAIERLVTSYQEPT